MEGNIVAKLEAFNPAGSVKDRVALSMIEDAEERGLLKPGATIIEPTSGNTGVGLAMVATIKGYRLILTMPETMSLERRNLLKALGAQIVLTDGMAGMSGSIAKAQELKATISGSVILQQFENSANAAVHERTTGEEIWEDTGGQIAAFVAGVGTGGTICGVARALKKHNPDVYVMAVEPAASPVLAGGVAAPHRIQGIGANFIPKIYDASVVDEVMGVPDDEAISAGRELAATEGFIGRYFFRCSRLCGAEVSGTSGVCRQDDCSIIARYGRALLVDGVVCIRCVSVGLNNWPMWQCGQHANWGIERMNW